MLDTWIKGRAALEQWHVYDLWTDFKFQVKHIAGKYRNLCKVNQGLANTS